ncbi:MAG TPA: hypothetical protein VGQ09_12465 [Chitinophagaceae bacterium]|jgi:hypothetical protein|nr:hypothetical protein [Chitinophagaceae bacterium]
MKDPCNEIDDLNFDSKSDLKKLLFRDKHTRIEGLFTEHFFFEQIIKGQFQEISSSWWFSMKDGSYHIIKLIVSINALTSFDIELLGHFAASNSNTFIIAFNEDEKKFYYLRFKKEYKNFLVDNFDRLKKLYPKNKIKAHRLPDNERSFGRINQAIDYLESVGALKKCAIERMFANCWLPDGFFWDIDFIVKHKTRFIAFEVKQKFPTRKGTWGLNIGLSKLFIYLNSIGIEVVHVILTKPLKDKTIPAIDLYTKDEYKRNAKWIATKVKSAFTDLNLSVAPQYTSIYGNSSLSFYHLQPEIFSEIKKVNSSTNTILSFLEKE